MSRCLTSDTDGMVIACPECDEAGCVSFRPRHDNYGCCKCTAKFDEPVEREEYPSGTGNAKYENLTWDDVGSKV